MTITRRTFLASTALMALARPNLLVAQEANLDATSDFSNAALCFARSNDVDWGGFFGARYKKSLERLSLAPIDKIEFVLDDVNFNQKRRFYNYSGDISGRYLETASLTSTQEKPTTPILKDVIREIVQYQKPDGHFGREVDWDKPIDVAGSTDQSLEMPILWGNGRLLLGLLAAYERFGDEKAFDAAKKLADFYVNIVVKRFCDPNRMEEYKQQAKGYAAAYVTCVFHGIEGLVRAFRLTGARKYLDCAVEMADFHETFDTLPVGHSHGSISAHEALIMLYEETKEKKYLERVEKRWNDAVEGGYVFPAGGVCEQYYVSGKSDEGCSEADWLRLNLMLWRNTGNPKYLDSAERTLYNEYQMNQWHTGGFGHRYMIPDEKGCFAWGERYAESWWCCSYHGPLGYYEFKEYLAVGAYDAENKSVKIYYNFPLDFASPMLLNGNEWKIASRQVKGESNAIITTKIVVSGPKNTKLQLALRAPEWAKALRVLANGTVKEYSVDSAIDGRIQIDAYVDQEYEISYIGTPYFEDRRFHKRAQPELNEATQDCVLRYGPNVMATKGNDADKIPDVSLSLDSEGVISLDENLLTSPCQMTDEERNGKHAFVFNVTLVK